MTQVMVEHIKREEDGQFWVDVYVDRTLYDTIGPFDTEAECDRAHTDLLQMLRQSGAIDVPGGVQ